MPQPQTQKSLAGTHAGNSMSILKRVTAAQCCMTVGCLASQIGSITTTGHSLGGALAALCAYDIADRLNSVAAGEDHLLHRGLQYLGSDALAKGARLAVQGTQSVAGRWPP